MKKMRNERLDKDIFSTYETSVEKAPIVAPVG